MLTTEQAIQMAREYGYGGQQITPEELTAFANAIERKTLLEAAERAEEFESQGAFVLWCKRMAGENHESDKA